MKIFYYSRSLERALENADQPIAFVPTMGALHSGHLHLVSKAANTHPLVVVSIFVNPAQFNNSEDLKKYPRDAEGDFFLLRNSGATHIFIPSVEEVYPESLPKVPLNIAPLDERFEGAYRPGHFYGVIQVLHRFFSMIHPTSVFFGTKDLQQCLVVEKLIQSHFPQIKQFNIETVRELNGLAKSSRNSRLSNAGLEHAAAIYTSLIRLKSLLEEGNLFLPLKENEIAFLKAQTIETEYLDLINLPSMDSAEKQEPAKRQALIFAGYLEGVRLIDNLLLPSSVSSYE